MINPQRQAWLDLQVGARKFDIEEAWRMGRALGLQDEIDFMERGRPGLVSVLPLLQQVMDSDGIEFGCENDAITTMFIASKQTYYLVGDWWPFFYAADKWRLAHTSTVLPEDPAERLKVLCQIIEQTNDGSSFDMVIVNTTLRELGVPNKLDGYIARAESRRGIEFDRNLVLAHAANNSSTFITSEVCVLEYKILGEHHVVERLPAPMLKICEAFASRRKRLNIPSVDVTV